MKPWTKLYMEKFGYNTSSFIPCEICESKAVDIHHIEARGMGGTKKPDTIENLMALCRAHHIEYGDITEAKPYLKRIHELRMKENGVSLD